MVERLASANADPMLIAPLVSLAVRNAHQNGTRTVKPRHLEQAWAYLTQPSHAGTAGADQDTGRSLPPGDLDPRVASEPLAADEADDSPFDPVDAKDAREKVLREIRARRGQRSFRYALIEAYDRRCAITGCDVLDVLEAAHITPYLGPETNHVTNGLLLRADLHTLFDTGLLAVDPETRQVLVAQVISDPVYRALHGKPLRAARTKASMPSQAALKQHRDDCVW
jgi:hypothetical protein